MNTPEISGKEWVDRWVDALNSGEFEQGPESLYDSSDHTYCCIGVCAHVAGESDKNLNGRGLPDHEKDEWWWPVCDLLIEVTDFDLVAMDAGSLAQFEEVCSHMNDELDWSFKQIATWIDTEARKIIEKHIDSKRAKQ